MQKVVDRLGVASFGDSHAKIGNYLLYPRRVIIEVIKSAFRNQNLFTPQNAEGVDTDANPFLYVEDANGTVSPKSRLIITDAGSEHTVRGEARPRIVVARSGGRFLSQGVMGRSLPYGMATGKQAYLDVFESAILIRCVARNRTESELLGLSVGSLITFFSRDIREKSQLHHIGGINVSDTQSEKSDSEVDQTVTTVTMEVSQSISWLRSKINPTVLADICVTTVEI